MEIKRYIIVQAIQTKENELIPLWDKRISFQKDEMFGNVIRLEDDYYRNYHSVVECIYDLKTKTLQIGIELNYYPVDDKLAFKIGEEVYYEKSHRVLAQATISDVVYEQYDLNIIKGSKIDKWWMQIFKDVKFENDTLYAIKQWKPFYLLNNGITIEWEHELYHKF